MGHRSRYYPVEKSGGVIMGGFWFPEVARVEKLAKTCKPAARKPGLSVPAGYVG